MTSGKGSAEMMHTFVSTDGFYRWIPPLPINIYDPPVFIVPVNIGWED